MDHFQFTPLPMDGISLAKLIVLTSVKTRRVYVRLNVVRVDIAVKRMRVAVNRKLQVCHRTTIHV